MKRFPIPLSSEKCKAKPQWDTGSHSLGWPLFKKLQQQQEKALVRKHVEQFEPLCTEGGIVTWWPTTKISMECLKKINNRTIIWSRNFTSGSVQFSSVARSCPTLCDPMDSHTCGNNWKQGLKEIFAQSYSEKHYSQEWRGGSNLNFHWWSNG